MKTRTWPYGTLLSATVLENDDKVAVLTDEHGEGHVLVGVTHSVRPEKGDKVTMQFCKGGRMRGYWKILKITEKAQ